MSWSRYKGIGVDFKGLGVDLKGLGVDLKGLGSKPYKFGIDPSVCELEFGTNGSFCT